MPGESATDTTDGSTEGIAMDSTEAAAGSAEDRDPEAYQSVLELTAESDEKHRNRTLASLER